MSEVKNTFAAGRIALQHSRSDALQLVTQFFGHHESHVLLKLAQAADAYVDGQADTNGTGRCIRIKEGRQFKWNCRLADVELLLIALRPSVDVAKYVGISCALTELGYLDRRWHGLRPRPQSGANQAPQSLDAGEVVAERFEIVERGESERVQVGITRLVQLSYF